MMRQYGPPRFRYETVFNRHFALPIGTVPIGTLFRFEPSRGRTRRPRKCIVRAWKTREYPLHIQRGVWTKVTLARGGHLAVVEDLSTGQLFELADHHILRELDREDVR